MLKSVLHCGQTIVELGTRSPDLGDSWSAIHSSRQDSCAVREQGHGLRHSESSGRSSVSSCWQIQHLRDSVGSGKLLEASIADGSAAYRCGLLRRIDWELEVFCSFVEASGGVEELACSVG